MTYDLAIIGGGPAAIAGAVYSARKRLNTVLIAGEIGGQSSVSETIFNWIGTPEVGGTELAQNLKKHAEYYTKDGHTLKMEVGHNVESLTKDDNGEFVIKTAKAEFRAKSVLISSGSRRRKLEVKGADEFENKGVVYCATCDGPLFSGQNVAVVGGGNAAFEAVLQLAQYCPQVTLFQRGDKFRADEISIEKAMRLPNVKLNKNIELLEIKGDKFVNALVYKDGEEQKEIAVGGIFVEIGQLPNTDFAKGLVTMDAYNKIVVDPMNQRASIEGVWSAGDCTNGLYHQNNIAAGDAVKAIEDLYIWIKTRK
jgi:alkyl hydroperoxide reductase subunit F